jgi:hypothetical protein
MLPRVWVRPCVFLLALVFCNAAAAAPIVVAACGNTLRRNELTFLFGDPTNGMNRPSPTGRRQLNWESVPPNVTNTNSFPANFFVSSTPRGMILTTPGTGLRVSDNNFADVNPAYASQFGAISPTRSFAPIGSPIVDAEFRTLGFQDIPATVSGFGVVFSDVDVENSTWIEPFSGARSLGKFFAPPRCDAAGFSFVGVDFNGGERITRVRIVAGQASIGPSVNDVGAGGSSDLVVMDDMIFSEPLPGDENTVLLTTAMRGENVVPGPGDPDGLAFGLIAIQPDELDGFLYVLSVQNMGTPASAHIHSGSGTALANLNPTFSNDLAAGIVTGISPATLTEFLSNPGAFYLDVETTDFPSGSVRGQLSSGAPLATKFTFPVVARVPGAGGTNFRTDMRLVNQSGAPVSLLVPAWGGGLSGTTITIAPGEQKVLDDIIRTQFNADQASAAIQLFTSRPLVASARIYNDQRANNQGTFGQFESGADDRVAQRMSGVLPGLSNSPIGAGPYRTNIGMFNGGGREAHVNLVARDQTGLALATAQAVAQPFTQSQQGTAALFPTLGTRQDFYVTYTTDVPTLYVYGSVVDNTNGDGVFIHAQ